MLLSIVISVYNTRDYLVRCVESIVEQIEPEIEMLLVDDGSFDGSEKICDQFAARYNFIRAIHKKNGGPSEARNVGLLSACGDYVAFVDSDDYWLPNAVKEIKKKIPGGFQIIIGKFCARREATGQMIFASDNNLTTGLIEHQEQCTVLDYLRKCHLSPCVWRYIINRKFILNRDLWMEPNLLNEDALWTPQMLCAAQNFSILDTPFYCYNIRNNSIMTTHSLKRYKDLLQVMDKLFEHSKELTEISQKKFVYMSISQAMLDLLSHQRKLPRDFQRTVNQWLREHNDIVKAALSEYPSLKALAFLVGSRAAMRAGAFILHCRNEKNEK